MVKKPVKTKAKKSTIEDHLDAIETGVLAILHLLMNAHIEVAKKNPAAKKTAKKTAKKAKRA